MVSFHEFTPLGIFSIILALLIFILQEKKMTLRVIFTSMLIYTIQPR